MTRDPQGAATGGDPLPGDPVPTTTATTAFTPDPPAAGDGEPGRPGGQPPAARDTPARPAGRTKRRGSFAKELPFLVLIAFILALLIKAFLVQAFWIPSGSMERTLLVNDRVLVNKVVYRFRDVHRGEIVVFNGDGSGFQKVEAVVAPPSNVVQRVLRDVQGFLGLGAPSDKDFIKRVIAVGGDTVACCDAHGRVTVNGKGINEPYIYNSGDDGAAPAFSARTIPKGQLWVMGDHRDGSSDSRANGTIPENKVVGRAFVRVWPVSRFGFLTAPSTFHGIPQALGDPSLPAGVALTLPIGALRLRRHRRLAGRDPRRRRTDRASARQ